MNCVTVSPKFQVVIPRAVRESLDIKIGQKMQVIRYEDRIELLPLMPMSKARGLFAGIDTNLDGERDEVTATEAVLPSNVD